MTGYLLAVMFNERERATKEMEYRAHHDALTGLLNRGEFENRVSAALSDASRRHALLYLDLDQFRVVNDTCGHLAGDTVAAYLRVVLTPLLRALRHSSMSVSGVCGNLPEDYQRAVRDLLPECKAVGARSPYEFEKLLRQAATPCGHAP